MPISNYTTKIHHSKTVGEIQDILTRHGAEKIMIENENRLPVAISFMYRLNNNEVGFRLPANYTGVLAAMTKDKSIPRNQCTKEQALRVSWRILRDWTEAQMAMVEAEQAELLQVFLPYAVLASGNTVYEDAVSNNILKLK
jgi:lantibiotic modifying enzyme